MEACRLQMTTRGPSGAVVFDHVWAWPGASSPRASAPPAPDPSPLVSALTRLGEGGVGGRPLGRLLHLSFVPPPAASAQPSDDTTLSFRPADRLLCMCDASAHHHYCLWLVVLMVAGREVEDDGVLRSGATALRAVVREVEAAGLGAGPEEAWADGAGRARVLTAVHRALGDP